ncbi:MAG: hypothetical protein R6V45_03635 [Oceanipulchritudo sp.]
MLFNSLQFLGFLVIVASGFAMVRRHLTLRNAFLPLASCLFDSVRDWRFPGLILLSTLVDFSIAQSAHDGFHALPVFTSPLWNGPHCAFIPDEARILFELIEHPPQENP